MLANVPPWVTDTGVWAGALVAVGGAISMFIALGKRGRRVFREEVEGVLDRTVTPVLTGIDTRLSAVETKVDELEKPTKEVAAQTTEILGHIRNGGS